MSLFALFCVGYVILCLLFSALVPCLRYSWKSLYDDLPIDIYKDLKKDRRGIVFKIMNGLVVSLLLGSFVVLCFLLFPFCIYWLNRSYKSEKERQEKEEKANKRWKEYFSAPPIKDEYKRPPIFLKIRTDIPFCPDRRQIIYMESKYNEPLNNYISNEYKNIEKLFERREYTFVYIPLQINKITQYGSEVVKYAYPRLDMNDILLQYGDYAGQIAETVLSFIDEPMHLNGGLIRYNKTEERHHIFSYYQFENFEENEIWEQIRTYFDSVGDGVKLYSLRMPKGNEVADFDFSFKAEELIEEIKERINQLRQTGISEMLLKSLFKFDDTVKLSKIVITKDFRIFLPDYNNMEITMTPLPKAVFLLFLKHPEGIMFKHLVDYKDELKHIYVQITNRLDLWKMQKSIDDITDPTKNAINEKCSRIREAFVAKFDESLAQNYFITGLRSEPKRITLDRGLVVWE